MTIAKTISNLVANTKEIKKHYPTVTCVRHEVKDIPLDELKQFAATHEKSLSQDYVENRLYVIYSPWSDDNQLDCDIWLYSRALYIKPAEYTEKF